MTGAKGNLRRPLRRAVGRFAAGVLLGLTTTFAVAAVCSWRADSLGSALATRAGERMTDPAGLELPRSLNGSAPPGTMYFELSLYEAPGATFGVSRLRPFHPYASTGAALPPKPPTPESIAFRWERSVLLPWVAGHRPWPDPAKGEGIWARAAGWPLRAFVCRVTIKSTPNNASHTWSARGGLILGSATKPGWADWPPIWPRVIPLTPLWPELLASTALYGAVWLLPFITIAAVRRARRTREGHCPHCGYDLLGDLSAGCPECGWGRASQTA